MTHVIGLIGDICAGKSTLAAAFAERGASVLGADAAVHEILKEEDVRREVRTAFGDAVFGADGEVDRTALADEVFADPAQLKALGRIIYPRTRRRMREAIRTAEREGRPAVLLDAPTLLESGGADLAEVLLYVSAPEARRRAWAAERGWPADEVRRRERALLPRAERMAAAQYVFENNGSLADLAREVRRFWEDHAWH